MEAANTRGMQDRKGFTVIELVMVVTIVGLLVLIVAPKIDVAGMRLNAAGQAVGATLLAVQRQAITQQHDIIVQFDATQQLMRIHEDRNNDGLVDAGERVRGVSLGEHVIYGLGGATARPMGPGPINFTKVVRGLPAVVFHRDGSASEAGGFYLTYATGTHAKDTRAIELERATGRALWFRYLPPNWKKVF